MKVNLEGWKKHDEKGNIIEAGIKRTLDIHFEKDAVICSAMNPATGLQSVMKVVKAMILKLDQYANEPNINKFEVYVGAKFNPEEIEALDTYEFTPGKNAKNAWMVTVTLKRSANDDTDIPNPDEYFKVDRVDETEVEVEESSVEKSGDIVNDVEQASAIADDANESKAVTIKNKIVKIKSETKKSKEKTYKRSSKPETIKYKLWKIYDEISAMTHESGEEFRKVLVDKTKAFNKNNVSIELHDWRQWVKQQQS